MACEFICDGCGKRVPAIWIKGSLDYVKPSDWFQRSDADGIQTSCSRECIEIIAQKSGKTAVVAPI